MNDYKNTLNLPDVKKFLMRANLVKSELSILQNWRLDNLYAIIRQKKSEKKLFLLHDGPIYANGKIHLGHAVNKVIKDIIVKFKGFMGYNAPYIPGWDCHGLPIELQVEKIIKKNRIDMTSKDFRNFCRKYASKQVELQKEDFIRLGVLGDWDNPYLTMDFKTESNIIRTFGKIISKHYLYKGVKPVHWCFQCLSALSDSEIEYNNHLSSAIDITFCAIDDVCLSRIFGISLLNKVVELVIWTTTPWTIPASQALSVHPDYNYQLIEINQGSRYIIVVSSLVHVFMNRIQCSCWEILGEVSGRLLEFLKFRHPFMSYNVPVVLSDHISCDAGTGVVHIAPNYGIEDYIIAQKYHLKVIDIVNDKGCYINVQSKLNGVSVLAADNLIINLLRQTGSLLHVDHSYQHSYPYCWRHMVPVIYRATSQWFLNIDNNHLRSKLLEMVKKVHWFPDKAQVGIETMITNRPDWCLSRQRNWGIPIPFFVHKKTAGLHPLTIEFTEIVAKLVEQYGIQIWWDLKVEDIIGNNDEALQYEKVLDTLDIWFDAGSTHDSVIAKRFKDYENKSVDLYVEGSDQYRGWFMSSLVISAVIKDKAPYKAVLSHGFVVDVQGNKMSKSIGNIVNPQDIVNKFGADILRLWIALSDYSRNMIFSYDIIEHMTDIYRRIRNTVRFCIINLGDFNPSHDLVKSVDMIALDRWIVNKALFVQLKIINEYNKYHFHNVVQLIMNFCSIEMGSFYLDVIKDRQYTTKKASVLRRSCQTALYHVIEAMVRWIAPILSFTANEIWSCIPGVRSKYVFTEEWYDGLFKINDTEVMNNVFWGIFLDVRKEVNRKIEQARCDGLIKGSLEANIILYVTSDLSKKLRLFEDELSFGLIVSSVTVKDAMDFEIFEKDDKKSLGLKVVVQKSQKKKCHRCWHYRIDVNQFKNYSNLCLRCVSNIFGTGEQRKFF